MLRKLFPLTAVAMALLATPASAERTAQEKANIATAIAFYEAAINEKDFDKARTYMGNEYIQHNPIAPDGIEGFKGFLGFLKENAPGRLADVKRSFADGDFVILHVHGLAADSPGRAVMDIFRFDESGKIVEHWDVGQDIPENPANDNTMF